MVFLCVYEVQAVLRRFSPLNVIHLLVNYTTKGFHIAVFAVNVNEPYSVSVLES